MATDRGTGRGDKHIANGKLSRDGQGQPRGEFVQAFVDRHPVLSEQIRALRTDPDLDPVRRARAIAQLAAALLMLAEQSEKQRVDPSVQELGIMDQFTASVHRVLAEQIETLRTNPDVDPEKKARAIARLDREGRRLRRLHFRWVTEAQRGQDFDFGAMLEEIWKENQPELERKNGSFSANGLTRKAPKRPRMGLTGAQRIRRQTAVRSALVERKIAKQFLATPSGAEERNDFAGLRLGPRRVPVSTADVQSASRIAAP
jgi:hypothetical protein